MVSKPKRLTRITQNPSDAAAIRELVAFFKEISNVEQAERWQKRLTAIESSRK